MKMPEGLDCLCSGVGARLHKCVQVNIAVSSMAFISTDREPVFNMRAESLFFDD